MAYFSKQTILEAYKNLATLSSAPSSQGATQRVSAIRYFIALDMFYKLYNRECDTTNAEDAATFIKLVGKVVAINKDCYTSNFYTSIGTNGDYSVGSNFYSVNVVSLSKNNIKEKYHFPRRGDSPLIDVAAGRLYENPDYIQNFKSYVSDSHIISLIIWLLRDTDLNDNDACQSVTEQLQSILTPSLSQILCPTREELSSYINEDSICQTVSQLSKEDILGLFKEPLNMVNYNEYMNLLLKKHNIILTGAPGTGKTFTAKAVAAEIISDGKSDWNGLTEEQKKQVAFVQFHPSYDYTDFVEGLRPGENGEFRRQDGYFKEFCKRALGEEDIISEVSTNLFDRVYNELLDDIRGGVITSYEKITAGDRGLAVNDKNKIIFGPEVTNYKTTSIRNLRLLFDYYQAKGIKDVSSLTRDDLWGAISTLTGGKTNTLDYIEYRWTLNQLLSRVTEADKALAATEPIVPKEDVTKKPFVFIIDEINRGELSKIFGELFYSIEPDYRGPNGTVQTQYNNMVEDDDVFKSGFYIPENVYIIGTMNDVDRGVEAMDFAIRRRFAWIEVTAEESADNMGITGLSLEKMKALNDALIANGLSRAYCIGGAYFRKLENDDYDSLWKYHLEGIVYEYFRGEPDAEEKLQTVKRAYEEAKLSTSEQTSEAQEEGVSAE